MRGEKAGGILQNVVNSSFLWEVITHLATVQTLFKPAKGKESAFAKSVNVVSLHNEAI